MEVRLVKVESGSFYQNSKIKRVVGREPGMLESKQNLKND